MIKIIIGGILIGLATHEIYHTTKQIYQGTKEAMDRTGLTFYQLYRLLSDDYKRILIHLLGNLLVIVYVFITLL